MAMFYTQENKKKDSENNVWVVSAYSHLFLVARQLYIENLSVSLFVCVPQLYILDTLQLMLGSQMQKRSGIYYRQSLSNSFWNNNGSVYPFKNDLKCTRPSPPPQKSTVKQHSPCSSFPLSRPDYT